MGDVEGRDAQEEERASTTTTTAPAADLFRIPMWPFALYLGVWLASSGTAAWFLMHSPETGSIAGSSTFPYALRGSLVLTAAGPLVAFLVWIVAWVSAGPGRRTGLLSGSLLRGGLVTLMGIVVWWVMLIVVDRVRLDRFW